AKVPAELNAALRGTVASRVVPGLELLPAKVMLVGTTFSTLVDGEGRYEFRHLPPGDYTLAVLRPGSVMTQAAVKLAAHQERVKAFTLAQDTPEGNMVRNAALTLHWLTPDRPDGWYPGKKCWEGDMLPLQAGAHYRLHVIWQDKATGNVSLRIFGSAGTTKPINELSVDGTAGELDLTVTKEMKSAQVVIQGVESPDKLCKHVAFVRELSGKPVSTQPNP
ncbi:MAG: carboxypeptidase-like regulatory domain-containing protein, partial [Kiritimatiellaeota bacterium]|nr:carboxypeptidase-like regulatory domain-containing protein [Kiritimatiellota bacterium]